MKKKILVCLVLMFSLGLIATHKSEVNQTRKGYNIYLQNGDNYVLSDSRNFPKAGYVLNTTESSCSNGGTISQNSGTKEISVEVSGPDKCNLYFDKVSANIEEAFADTSINKNSVDVVTLDNVSSTCTNTVAYDGTADNNLRYVGANPCNYVTFNGEQWRIVGLMNNINNGNDNTETRMKLVRVESLGNFSWDTSADSINYGWGVNDWSYAHLMNELNGDYLNTSLNANTNWYNGSNNQKTGEFDYTKRLSASAQSLIGDAKWHVMRFARNLDDIPSSDNTARLIPSISYFAERDTTVEDNQCIEGYCPRTKMWTGKVALLYPSDYGYATTGGTTYTRVRCIGYGDNNLINYISSYYWDTTGVECSDNDWLKPSTNRWFLSGDAQFETVSEVGDIATFAGKPDGSVNSFYNSNALGVYPAVYLKASIKITGGVGSVDDPFTVG